MFSSSIRVLWNRSGMSQRPVGVVDAFVLDPGGLEVFEHGPVGDRSLAEGDQGLGKGRRLAERSIRL